MRLHHRRSRLRTKAFHYGREFKTQVTGKLIRRRRDLPQVVSVFRRKRMPRLANTRDDLIIVHW